MRVKRRKISFPKFKLTRSFFFLGVVLGLILLPSFFLFLFEKKYQGKVYPGIYVEGVNFGGKTSKEVKKYLLQENLPFEELKIEFIFEDRVATLSGKLLSLGLDSTLSATQAYLIGRSGNFFSDSYQKYRAKKYGITLTPLFKFEEKIIDDFLKDQAEKIEIPPKNALFKFEGGRVTVFQLSSEGQTLDVEETKKTLIKKLSRITKSFPDPPILKIDLLVRKVKPKITIEKINNLGIRELIGTGYSYFWGSASERIHNIKLAASKINGVLVAPGETFSFNDVVGEISAKTGYKQAYIIKQGRTILDDGGGVCQVSTTFFRAVLNAGLFIVERTPHAYRVSYYEKGGFSPGLDATVFAPRVDLKFKNNTPAHILIQAFTNTSGRLTINLYGKSDGRKVEISKVKIWDQTPPPPDEYIDDPNLAKGVIKQIDFAAPGAKTSFDYKVTKGKEVLQGKTFYSNFKPWRARFLRGTKE